jgi:hypothetical protein
MHISAVPIEIVYKIAISKEKYSLIQILVQKIKINASNKGFNKLVHSILKKLVS